MGNLGKKLTAGVESTMYQQQDHPTKDNTGTDVKRDGKVVQLQPDDFEKRRIFADHKEKNIPKMNRGQNYGRRKSSVGPSAMKKEGLARGRRGKQRK